MDMMEMTHTASGVPRSLSMAGLEAAPDHLLRYFRRVLEHCQGGFRATLLCGPDEVTVHWSSESPSSGLVTIQIGDRLVSSAAVATGLDATGDDRALNALRRMVCHANQEAVGAEAEVGTQAHRPLLSIVTWPQAVEADVLISHIVLRAIALAFMRPACVQ
jgi:hypothetical protein